MAEQEDLPKPQPVTVHCASGLRASLAIAVLGRMGFEVTLANGLYTDWEKASK